MALTDINLWEQVARIYKGYLVLHDGSNTYRFEMLTKFDVTNNANLAPLRSWDGKPKFASTGPTGTATISVPQTADLVDAADYTAATFTPDKKTVSYFLDRIWKNEVVPFTWEGIRTADAVASGSAKIIHHKFEGVIESVGDARDPSTGVHMHEFVVQITSHEELRRTAT